MKNSNFVLNFERNLKVKNYASNTIENYVCQIKMFLNHFKEKDSPKHISSEQIKDYLLTAKEVNSQRHMHSAIKLFYKLTVHQPMKFRFIEYARKEKKLPKVIEKEFLHQQISKIQNLKHKAIITLTYSTGMRVSEVINLKISDIDSKRMIILIRNAKGAKDRIVPLTVTVLELLREYFKEYKPKEYLFNGQFDLQYSDRSCNQIVKKYLGKEYHMHLLRHSNATALLESGTDINYIKEHLGHSSVKTTQIYCHVSTASLSKLNLPI